MKVGMIGFGIAQGRSGRVVERPRGSLRERKDHFGCRAGGSAASRDFSRTVLSDVAGDNA